MAIYFKCPKCEEYIVDEQGELWDSKTEAYKCSECGAILTKNDTVDYDINFFFPQSAKSKHYD